MKIKFTKMEGLGNDFVVIDGTEKKVELSPEVIAKLCDRRFGIGADGVLIVEPSKNADFKMRVFNADGGEVEMCGNGARCIANFLRHRGKVPGESVTLETLSGIIEGGFTGDDVRVCLGEPILDGPAIPVNAEGHVIDHCLKIGSREFTVTCVSMGNPHCVIFTDDIGDDAVGSFGPLLEADSFFPNRANVEFVRVESEKEITVRVWERGVGKTLACGTGAGASVVASVLKGLTGREVTVCLDGGELVVEWADDDRVYITGPAREVFEGRIEI